MSVLDLPLDAGYDEVMLAHATEHRANRANAKRRDHNIYSVRAVNGAFGTAGLGGAAAGEALYDEAYGPKNRRPSRPVPQDPTFDAVIIRVAMYEQARANVIANTTKICAHCATTFQVTSNHPRFCTKCTPYRRAQTQTGEQQ